jgi:hypothetical protein
VTYTPDFGFVGTDTFSYTIADAHGAVSNAAVDSVTVGQTAQTGTQSDPLPVVVFPAQPHAPSPTGLSPNALFVSGLYRDILGRQPDTGGLNYWTGLIQNGLPEATVSLHFLDSTEHLSAAVTGYYQTLLGRAPDSVGLAGWVSDMQAGATEQQVIVGLLTSSEFLSHHNSVDSFVNGLYSNLLGRTADAQGLGYWETQLTTGAMTNARVVMAFISQDLLKTTVDGYYQAYLGRAADAGGEEGFLVALQFNGLSLDQAAISFLTSTEYTNNLAAGTR